jgi:MFS family permease
VYKRWKRERSVVADLDIDTHAKSFLPQLLRPLRFTDFALLWTGQTLSRLGNGVYEVALGWTVFAKTGSATSMGIVLAAFSIPQVLFLLVGGVFGDRYDRRKILLAADVIASIAMGTVAAMIFSETVTLPFLIALAAVATFFLRHMPRKAFEMNSTAAHEIKAALRYTMQTQWLLYIIGLSVVVNVFTITTFFVLVPYLIGTNDLPISVLGSTLTAQGAAGVAISVLLSRKQQSRFRGIILFALASMIGAAYIVLGVVETPSLIILSGAILGIGFGAGVFEHTLIQQYVPEEMLSRVYSLNMFGSFTLFPLAYAFVGILAGMVGAEWVLVGGGVIEILFCLVALLSRPVRKLM